MDGFRWLVCGLALVGSAPALAEDAPPAPLVAPVPLEPLATRWPEEVEAAADAAPVRVELLLQVSAAGVVEGVEVLSGAPPFTERAVAQAVGLRFVPATEGGEPVAVELPLTLTYDPPLVNLRGEVRDAWGTPLVGATVRLGERAATTDATGGFAFRGAPAGPATLSVEAPGHVLPSVDVLVEADRLVEVRLVEDAPAAPADPGVVGVWRRDRVEVVSRAMAVEDLRATPGTMGDPLRAVANLPGAVRTPLDAGWLLVRGGQPDDTAVYLDGVRVPLVYHLGGFTSVLHPALISGVALYPGGQSARYGRALAGAVDVTIGPPPEVLDLRVGANLVHASVFAAAPLPSGGIAVAARRSYLDAVLSVVPGITDEQAAIAPRFYDAEARLQLGPSATTVVGYVDTVDASDTSGNRLAITVGTQRVHQAWTGAVGDRAVRVLPFVARETRLLEVDGLDLLAETRGLGGGARVETPDDGLGAWGWSAGVDATAKTVSLDVNNVGRSAFVASPEPYLDLRVGSGPSVVAGLRADTMLVSGQLPRAGLSPRLSGRWPVRDGVELTADAGGYHQPPPEALVVGPPVGETLELARAWGGGAGASLGTGALTFEGSAWARRAWNTTAYEIDGSVGQGEGLAFGVETQTRYTVGRLRGWLTASWVRSLRREERGLPWSPGPYDQPLSAVLVGLFDAGKGWTLSGRARYATGFPSPPVEGGVAYDVLAGESRSLDPDDRGRLPDFHSLDLKISRRVVGRRWQVEGYLDVQNVYNRRIPEPAISGFPELTSEYVYGYGLPVLPIFGVEVGARVPTRRSRAPAAPPSPPPPPPDPSSPPPPQPPG